MPRSASTSRCSPPPAISPPGRACVPAITRAGKNKPASARKGNIYLKTTLCNAATSASKKNGSYYKDKYHKLKARIGGGKAALAIAHKLLIAIYHVLRGEPFRDLGENYLNPRNVKRSAARHVKLLEKLGFQVKLEPLPQNPM